ncbi:hypothetical protein ACFSBZ_03860 [Amnibacterium flavum]|uniref:PH domain-containing protein n=1 Tax=Amnibacterium flavum TaxID=2173173 RepID=A0A2V1HPB1_9MICO|nr:hypothetical protein [Amnibacterium flavum]PVZ94365.1 hypothetical protein DDQ50_11610 [Amnibacterium flavum]
MADLTVPLIVVAVLIVLAWLGMYLGWRARGRRQGALPAPPAVPVDLGPASLTAEVAYVATTLAEKPLERVVARGLGIRGKATVAVHPEGIVLAIRGTDPVFLAAERIESAGTGTFAIDRVVERDGLAVITWRLGDTLVDSYLRPLTGSAKQAIIAAARSLTPASVTSDTDIPERNDPSGIS